MKKVVILGAIGSALALTACATQAAEVSVKAVDLSTDTYQIAAENFQLGASMLDMDVSMKDGKDVAQSLTIGVDLNLPETNGLSPYASVDHTMVEGADSYTSYELGASYAVLPDTNLDASFIGNVDDWSEGNLQASVDYQISPKLNTEVETVYNVDSDSSVSTTVTATYDFTPVVYAEVGYEFEGDTAAVQVGYKF